MKSVRGQASWYFSQPFYDVHGSSSWLSGQSKTVTVTVWLDHEWSSQPLAAEQLECDWFSIQFDAGTRLMTFRLREADRSDGFLVGTWITPNGEAFLSGRMIFK